MKIYSVTLHTTIMFPPKSESIWLSMSSAWTHPLKRSLHDNYRHITNYTRTSPIVSLQEPNKQDCKSPIRNRHGAIYCWLIYSEVLWVPLSLSIYIKILCSLYVWYCLQYGYKSMYYKTVLEVLEVYTHKNCHRRLQELSQKITTKRDITFHQKYFLLFFFSHAKFIPCY